MAPDRRTLSRSERKARRERVRRRQEWAASTQTDTVLTVDAHGRTIRLYESAGKIPACWGAGKPYERRLLEHIHDDGFTGLAVDAGANIGNHTLWMAAVCGLHVIAYEPIKHVELARNVALNGLDDQVRVEPVALGDTDTAALHSARGRLRVGAGRLPVRRLDDYELEGVGLIKIDVEGMEPAVLRGGEATIRRDRPVIFAEEWGHAEHDAIAAVLEPWGYQMTRRFAGRESATPVGRWDP